MSVMILQAECLLQAHNFLLQELHDWKPDSLLPAPSEQVLTPAVCNSMSHDAVC